VKLQIGYFPVKFRFIIFDITVKISLNVLWQLKLELQGQGITVNSSQMETQTEDGLISGSIDGSSSSSSEINHNLGKENQERLTEANTRGFTRKRKSKTSSDQEPPEKHLKGNINEYYSFTCF
jgi:hypothetical protein